MLTVLSPAKKLDCSASAQGMAVTQPNLLPYSRKLNQILRGYSELDLMELMHISARIAALNVERNHSWETPFTEKNAGPAILTFSGDVYQNLDARTLNKVDLKFTQNHLRILSGLYGVLRPLDLMQAYRLEMGTKIPSNHGKNLYEFWDRTITDKLNEALSHHKSKTLINLASNEYFKAIKPKMLDAEIITPTFKEIRNGDYKMIGIFAKKARGLMARFIIKHRIDQAEDLKAFDLGGYGFDKTLSNDMHWIFTRK